MPSRIIGISVVKNEDIYIEQSLSNVIDFCDEIKVVNHNSTDKTISIVEDMMKKHPHISLHHLKDIKKSHKFVEPYANTDTWIFGVDGDELYDPYGMIRLKEEIINGKYKDAWRVRGMFFHVVNINGEIADGYMSPPSKDPNKLWNLRMLKS